MPKDYFDFHPYRFQFLTAAADARREVRRSGRSAVGQDDPGALNSCHHDQFAGMSEAEFHGRLELMTEMRHLWNRWSAAGSGILDFSGDMASMARSRTVELPWNSPVENLEAVYVHFGAEAELFFSDRRRFIEGAYLETQDDAHDIRAYFVCNHVSRPGTFGNALIAQSEVITGRLHRKRDVFSDFGGDPSLVPTSPRAEMVASALYAITHILGPTADPTAPAHRSSRLSLN